MPRIKHCGLAMVQSSLICGLGLMVFYFSDFLPSSRFAWMLLALLMVGLAANLVLLPALVVGPLGKPFEAQYQHPTSCTKASAPTSPHSARCRGLSAKGDRKELHSHDNHCVRRSPTFAKSRGSVDPVQRDYER